MKKRLIMVMCCGIMILGNLSGCNAMKTKETEYHWPTSTLVKSLPVPESKYGEIVLDAEDSFEIDVFNTSKSQFADYINACKENGFNVDYYGTEDSYDAENKDGYTLSLSYDKRKKTMNIDIYDLDDDTEDTQEPEETEEPEETDDSENAKDTSKDSSKTDKKEKKKTSSKKKDGAVDADFKKMMDSYEDFFDEYIEFMKKYENSDDVAGMFASTLAEIVALLAFASCFALSAIFVIGPPDGFNIFNTITPATAMAATPTTDTPAIINGFLERFLGATRFSLAVILGA